MKAYDLGVFTCRVQPLHNAHVEIICKAAKMCHSLLIIVGSCYQPRSFKNPWTFEERKQMVEETLYRELSLKWGFDSYKVVDNYDTIYNDDAWVMRVQERVDDRVSLYHFRHNAKIALIGHKKEGDSSTYYLDKFPQWDFVDIPVEQDRLDATTIRNLYFNEKVNMGFLSGVVPAPVAKVLEAGINSPMWKSVLEEKNFAEGYKKQFAGLKYPVSFNTADAVVTQSGHVLAVKRKAFPGKGLWALPGGYLDIEKDNSLEDCMLRELEEETGIELTANTLRANIKESKVFGAIGRSSRGRIITEAFYIPLQDRKSLPKVVGGDDAEKAVWLPLSEVNPSEWFEDHAEILSYFTKINFHNKG